jgi:predicted nucleic acid-binding protein
VILVDANILLYSHVASISRHQAARKWLDEKLNAKFPTLRWLNSISVQLTSAIDYCEINLVAARA